MKKIIALLIGDKRTVPVSPLKILFNYGVIFLLLLSLCGCVYYSGYYPQNGVWYCDELNLEIDFDTHEGKIYTAEDEFVPVKVSVKPGFAISYIENGMTHSIYTGKCKPQNDNMFIFIMLSRQDPTVSDIYSPIDMNQEFVFYLVEA